MATAQVQEYVDKGFFNLTDYCWAEGWSEWKIVATFASKKPNYETNTSTNDCSENISKIDQASAGKEEKSLPLNESGKNDDTTKKGIGSYQKVGAFDCQRLTSMASLGFFGLKTVANNPEKHSSKDLSEKMVHLARAGEIFDKCRISEIPNKIASGYLNSNDLWFNETKNLWESISELRG